MEYIEIPEHPLLIHTNTNDDDVNVLEVEHLIKSLKADGKKFDYEIFSDIPGGHSFDRMDTRIAKEIRVKIYIHLANHLKPSHPIKTGTTFKRPDTGSDLSFRFRYPLTL